MSMNTAMQTIENTTELVRYLEDGNKPIESWKIGTEHEKFGYNKKDLKPLQYSGACSIESILVGLKETFGWLPIVEDNCLIGLSKGGANISLEPGGQLELSGAPLDNVHETCMEVANHLAEVKTIADRIEAGFIGLGAAPVWKHSDMPVMPKGRYKLMAPYMEKVGSHGTQMMFRTCTVQVNLDYSSELDMVKKFRVGLALQPIATALFSASPFFEGKNTGYSSYRARIWQDTDKARTGMLPFVFEDGFGFEAWVNYALDVPMYFVYRNGKYINAAGQSFRDFMNGNLPALPGELPLLSDWADHLTTIFPEVRLKQFLEMRGADGGPWSWICALPAFWVGLLYDQNSLDAAWDLCKHWTSEQRDSLRKSASKEGLSGGIDNISIMNLSKQVLAISRAGLEARQKSNATNSCQDESHFLDILTKSAETGIAPADRIMDFFQNKWNKNPLKAFEEFSY